MRLAKTTISAALAATLATAATAAAATPVAGSWTGTTSQKDANGTPGKLSFKVPKGGKRATHFKWQELAKCDSGKTSISTITARSLKVTKGGHVDSTGTFETDAGNGFTAQHSASLHGRFTSKRAFKATFEDLLVIFDQSGNQVDTCHTGTVKFSARP